MTESLIPAENAQQVELEKHRVMVEQQKKLHVLAIAKEFHAATIARFHSLGDDFFFLVDEEEAALRSACAMLNLAFLQEECC